MKQVCDYREGELSGVMVLGVTVGWAVYGALLLGNVYWLLVSPFLFMAAGAMTALLLWAAWRLCR